VTESTGQRDASINVADGEKQASILRAEGLKQSAILEAEGQREAQLLKAEGYSAALQRIYSVAQDIDSQTMTLQYFEALKDLGASPATKYIFPMEFTSLLENFVNRNKE
jgi:regulator of protease activity HflC (stomatin/prohibitin superfamily)